MENTRIKLNKIFVDGYKNLSECTVHINDFNVIVGPNNSGKSNFLEIFAFVQGVVQGSDDFHKKIFEDGFAPRGDASVCQEQGKNDTLKPIVIQFFMEVTEGEKPTLHVEYSLTVNCRSIWANRRKVSLEDLGFISEQIKYKNKKNTGKPIVLINREKREMQIRKENATFASHSIELFSSCMRVTRAIYPDFQGLDHNFSLIYSSILSILSSKPINLSAHELSLDLESGKKPKGYKLVSFDLIEAIADLYNNSNEVYEEFRNTLCQILDLEDVKFQAIPVPDEIKKDIKDVPDILNYFALKLPNCKYSRLDNYSDGTFRVVALLVSVLSQEKDSVISLIEEPENCLHPKALKTIISYLKQKSKEKQIIITTHSSYVLNNVSPEDVIVARFKESGNTTFDRIKNIKELRKRLSRGFISFGDLLYDEFRDE
ncbi:MAG: AAA family ATPase [Deltaproteobacteria bacterium]|nr:AAA family ATPase [Deltaproteobacteria bacterium]